MSGRVDQVIGDCRIRALIGEGGMGAVYAADHRGLGRPVALKVLRGSAASDERLVARFLTEARATAAITHPGIVKVLDMGQTTDGLPYLAMELLEGETVGARLRRMRALPVPEVADIVVQTARAVGAAHATGIIHRDLKPDNLYLVRDPRAPENALLKVLDFGIAKLRADLPGAAAHTRTGTLLGTPAYMAPEQCRGLSRELDHRADIYALGVIAYELSCGVPPFFSEGFGDLMMMHMSKAPEPLRHRRPDLPPGLEEAILRALAKDKDARFPGMLDFAEAVAIAVPGARTAAPPLPTPVPAPSEAGPSGTLVWDGPGGAKPRARDSTTFSTAAGEREESPPPPRRRALWAGLGLVLAGTAGWALLPERRPAPAAVKQIAPAAVAPAKVEPARIEETPPPPPVATADPAPPPEPPKRTRRPRRTRREAHVPPTDPAPQVEAAVPEARPPATPAPPAPAPTPPPSKRKPLIF